MFTECSLNVHCMFTEFSMNVPGMGRPSGVFVQRAGDRVPGVLDPRRQLARGGRQTCAAHRT